MVSWDNARTALIHNDSMMELIKRQAIRGFILTPEGRVLLMNVEEPVSNFRVWITPGRGILRDENPEECLRREIVEETGLRSFHIGPQIWTRRHTFDWAGQNITQEETYYLIKVHHFTPVTAGNPDATERIAFRQFRWWTVDEILASKDVFAPRLLAQHLVKIIENGPPKEPFDCGI